VRPAALLLALSLAVPVAAARSAGGTQRVVLRTEDGLNLTATWYEPSSRPAPAVILVHMLHRTRRDWDAVASRLASEGIGALALDLRGHGDSQGVAGPDYSPMLADVRTARRHLSSRFDVLHSRIGVAGASIGANLAALDASTEAGIASLALLSPSLDYRGLRIESALRKYGNHPVLLVAGDDDPYALRSAKDLQKAGGGIRELLVLPSAGHGTNMFAASGDLQRQLVDWFRRTLQ
jgi:pimeloyl-ACP methyl ester carboxylesterase